MDFIRKPPDKTRDHAQLKVERESRRLDGEQATAEYVANRAAQSENMSRLREQRLARDAADAAGKPKSKPRAAAKKKVRRVTAGR